MDITEWLANLKVGDKVIVKWKNNYESNYNYEEAVISKVLKQYFVVNNDKYYKDCGKYKSDNNFGCRIQEIIEPTEYALNELKCYRLRLKVLSLSSKLHERHYNIYDKNLAGLEELYKLYSQALKIFD